MGTVQAIPVRRIVHENLALKALLEISAWTFAIAEAACAASADAMPIFLGRDRVGPRPPRAEPRARDFLADPDEPRDLFGMLLRAAMQPAA